MIFNDYALNWSYNFQDPASKAMYEIIDLHDQIIFYLFIILAVVVYYLFDLLKSNKEDHLPNLTDSEKLELGWTIAPALFLWGIAIPSLYTLYSMDEIFEPKLTIKAIGAQWYWIYEYSDFTSQEHPDSITFESFLIPDSDLDLGDHRQLAVDNYLVLPIHTSIRILTTSIDVIHSFTVPSLGFKIDAMPGRLNGTSVYITRPSTYYGQCSELCGALHSGMPIGVKAVNLPDFITFIDSQINS